MISTELIEYGQRDMSKIVQGCVRESNGGQSVKTDGVGDGVKGRAQIEEDEDG